MNLVGESGLFLARVTATGAICIKAVALNAGSSRFTAAIPVGRPGLPSGFLFSRERREKDTERRSPIGTVPFYPAAEQREGDTTTVSRVWTNVSLNGKIMRSARTD